MITRRFIFCCGMSRSGGTLQYQLVKGILEKTGIGVGFGFPKEIDNPKVYIAMKSEPIQNWMVDRVKRDRAVMVNVYRDPRDVALSLFRFFSSRRIMKEKIPEDELDPGAVWETVIRTHLPNAIKWQGQWEELGSNYPHRFYSVPYEYMVKGLYGEVHRLSAFLSDAALGKTGDIDMAVEMANEIVDEYSIDRNLERMADLQEKGNWMRSGESMVTAAHIGPNKGAPGQWRKILFYRDIVQVQEAVGVDWFHDHGYPLVEEYYESTVYFDDKTGGGYKF